MILIKGKFVNEEKKEIFFKKKQILFAYFVELHKIFLWIFFGFSTDFKIYAWDEFWKEDAREKKDKTILERTKESWKVYELLQKGHVGLVSLCISYVGCPWKFEHY